MKKYFLYVLYLTGFVSLVGCSPGEDAVKEAIEKNPDIVFAAIEKNPEKFVEVVKKAMQLVEAKAKQQAEAETARKREEEFKNPHNPVVDESRVFFGAKDAKITIVEYSDFECPYCARGFSIVKQLLAAYPNQVRVFYKHLPLDFHQNAMPTAKYFEAIAIQNRDMAIKFHDTIFMNQGNLKMGGEKWLKEIAQKLGVNMKKLEEDLNSALVTARISEDVAEAQKYRFNGTPGFLVGGVSVRGAFPVAEFKAIIDRHLANKN